MELDKISAMAKEEVNSRPEVYTEEFLLAVQQIIKLLDGMTADQAEMAGWIMKAHVMHITEKCSRCPKILVCWRPCNAHD